MKYSLPKINISVLKRAEEYFNSGVKEFKERLLKTESALLESVFAILLKFFSTMGAPNLTRRLRVKEDTPRTSPLSRHYNKFLNSLKLDLEGSFQDQGEVDRAVSYHFNYAQSNRNTYDGILKEVNQRLTDFAIISQAVDTKEIWYKDSFDTPDKVDGVYEGYTVHPGYVDIRDGIFTLGYTESEDVLIPDNISSIDDSEVNVDPGFIYSNPYYGRQYGVVDNTDMGINSEEQPRIENIDPADPWYKRSVYNLVDPEGVDTWWEVEVTARENMASKTGRFYGGPHFFLGDADERNGISIHEGDSRVYRYSNGWLCYNTRSYLSEFFRDSNNKPIRRLVTAKLEIGLNEPQTISTIRMERKPEGQYTIFGGEHAIYVANIETRAPDGEWESIPGFTELETYRTSSSSVKGAEPTKPGRRYRGVTSTGTKPSETTDVTDKPTRRYRGVTGSRGRRDERPIEESTIQLTSEERRRIMRTTPGAGSISVLRPSDSQFSRVSSWNFSSRAVKDIRITLYTDEPYRIRYSMGKHKIIYDPLGPDWLTPKKIQWVFVQYAGYDPADKMDKPSFISSVSGWSVLAYLAAGGIGALLSLLGKVKIESKVDSIHTLDRKDDSDLYRWSIAISDISATTSNYYESGELISIPYLSPQPIDRIMLYVNHELNNGTIEYYIIPEGGDPVRLQPWEEMDDRYSNGRYIPKILYINSDLPPDRRERSKWGQGGYIDTPSPLHKFRLRAVLVRGDDIEITPIIRDYRIRIIPKELGGTVSHVE